MSNLIDERDKRTKNRKKMKKAFDKAIDLASVPNKDGLFKFAMSEASSNGKIRLLDEGAIVTADGDLDIFIMRDTVEKFLNGQNKYIQDEYGEIRNLTDDYSGTINIGHMPFSTFPVGIIGSWKKSDFSTEDNGNGRIGLDVELHLNEDHPLVQALVVQGIDVGPSVEMYLHFNEEASKEKGVPAVDEIFISDFAIVGECGNVGSSETISLKGGKEMKKEDITLELTGTEEIKELEADLNEEQEIDEITTEETTDEETEESDEEDKDEESVEEAESEEALDEESDDEESDDEEEAEDEEAEEESVDKLSIVEKLMAKVEALETDVDELKKENAELKKSNRKKEKKLKALKEADKEFTERFKGLSVSLGLTKDEGEEVKEVTESRYATGDGIGE